MTEAHEKTQKEARKRQSPSSQIVHDAILREGKDELNRSSRALFWSGLAAGLSMGFSMIAEGLLHAHLPDIYWRPLISKIGYSIGFIIVILGRQQLFTENTLTPILPLFHHKNLSTLVNVLRLWTVVLISNLIGGVIIALLVTKTNAFDEVVMQSFIAIGKEALSHNFNMILLRGIFAGWLIALIVWLMPFAEAARIYVIILLTYLIGLGQMSHVIAGSIEVYALASLGETTWFHAVLGYTIPSLIGNVIGGVAMVAVINHAQVAAGNH